MADNNTKRKPIEFDMRINISAIVIILGFLFSIYGWYFKTNVNAEQIAALEAKKLDKEIYLIEKRQQDNDREELKEAIKELTQAVNRLNIKIERLDK